jgi:hypothetical protein
MAISKPYVELVVVAGLCPGRKNSSDLHRPYRPETLRGLPVVEARAILYHRSWQNFIAREQLLLEGDQICHPS